MKLIISFCAPAVMESMATTAPTPKIMPSMVSRLRSLWARRLESPMANSGKMPLIPGILFASPAAGWNAAHGVAASALLFASFLLPFLANGSARAITSSGFTPPASTMVDSLRLAIWTRRSSNWDPLRT